MKSISELLKAVVTEKKEVVVGTAQPESLNTLNHLRTSHTKAHEQIKTEIMAFIEKKQAEHAPVCEEYKAREKEALKEILIAAGIPESEHEKEYSINMETGEICRIDIEIDPRLRAAFGNH